MPHVLKPIAILLLLCSPALAENAPGRPLEESIVISPVIIVGKIIKADGESTETGAAFKKFQVEVKTVLRGPGRPENGAAITVYAVDGLKIGEEAVLFLGGANGNGCRVHRAAPADELDKIKKLLALEARADKELTGTDKLRAAFFHAHKLRPVLLAAAEKKALRPAGAIPEKEQAALLSTLASALAEASKPSATAETEALAELLRKVLSGPGGLPEYRMRNERVAQFWNRQLNAAAQRKKYRLMKLALGEPAADVAKAVAEAAVAIRGAPNELILRPGVRLVLPGEAPKPAPPKTKPAPGHKPQPVLELTCCTGKKQYDLTGRPGAAVDVTITFSNVGDRVTCLNSYMIFPVLAQMVVVDPAGKKAVYTATDRLNAPEIPAMGAWSFKELKPGHTLSFTEKVPASFFPKNGEYVLSVFYKNTHGEQFGINAWTGDAPSAPVTVKIVRRAQPAAEPAANPEPESGKQ
ncbi:MAG: hypothetical protein ABIF82_01455 [Planctomycetota bacterium]